MGGPGKGGHGPRGVEVVQGAALSGEDSEGGRVEAEEDEGRGGGHCLSVAEVAPGGDGSKAAVEVPEGGEARYRREGADILFP